MAIVLKTGFNDKFCFICQTNAKASLPKECSINILTRLSCQDVVSCSLVSKEWAIAASDNSIWSVFFSKAFPKEDKAFFVDPQISPQLTQKELFKYRFGLETKHFVQEKFPENGAFFPLEQNGRTFFISELGNIYSWNEKTQEFCLIKNLLGLSQEEQGKYPYNHAHLVDEFPLSAKQVFALKKDAFAVLCREYEKQEVYGPRYRVTEIKKDTLRFFNENHIEVDQISLDSEMKDIRVTDTGQLVGITDSNVMINISEKCVQTNKFRSKKRIEILNLNQGKCLISALGSKKFEDKFSLYLFDIVQGTKLLWEFNSSTAPLLPLHSEFSTHPVILVPQDGKCQIFNPAQECHEAIAEIPFGKNFILLASFTPQGKLLLTDLKSKIVILDPDNGWKQIQNVKINFKVDLGIHHGLKGFEDMFGQEIKVDLKFEGSEKILFSYSDKHAVVFDLGNGSHEFVSRTGLKFGKAIGNGLIANGKCLTNFNASNKRIILQFAKDLTKEDTIEYENRGSVIIRLKKLPIRIRNAICGQLFNILSEKGKISSISHYWGMGEDAFLNSGKMWGIATSVDRIEAIQRVAENI